MKILYNPADESINKLQFNSSTRNVVEVNAKNWEKEVLQSQILTAVDFWEKGCPWCNRFNQIFEEAASEYTDKIKFAKLNIKESMENQQIAFKYDIIGKPTVIFFYRGKILKKVLGIKTRGRLKKVFNDVYKMRFPLRGKV